MENNRYKEALSSASCPNCGGPAALGEMSFDEHHLRIENARLREEVTKTKLLLVSRDQKLYSLETIF
jgi:homeobox-leucine zipper protein